MKHRTLHLFSFFICCLSLQAQDIKPTRVKKSEVSEFVRQLHENKPLPIAFPAQPQVDESAINKALIESMIDYAKKYLGCRYRAGGKGPKVFDCSGFVGYVWSHFGFKMGSSSRDQYLQGHEVAFADVKPGDLLFFGGRAHGTTRIGHVGMVVSVDEEKNKVKFIHAATSSGVKIDQYPDGGYYSNRYIGAKRLIE